MNTYTFLVWIESGQNKANHQFLNHQKEQVGNDQEKTQSERNSQSKNRGGKKTK